MQTFYFQFLSLWKRPSSSAHWLAVTSNWRHKIWSRDNCTNPSAANGTQKLQQNKSQVKKEPNKQNCSPNHFITFTRRYKKCISSLYLIMNKYLPRWKSKLPTNQTSCLLLSLFIFRRWIPKRLRFIGVFISKSSRRSWHDLMPSPSSGKWYDVCYDVCMYVDMIRCVFLW